MKKVLFATTALVASAGFASADVALSGSAQMGVQGGSGDAVTQFVQDIDVTFTLSGETPGGITFGAAVDLDEDAGAVGTDDAGVAIFISGDFGTLTMGDTDGGFDAGMQEVNIGSPGSINDDETTHAGYSGNAGLDGTFDGQILSYSYSVSGFTITGSIEQDDGATIARPFNLPDDGTAADGLEADEVFGIGASYAGSFGGGSYTVGAGYQMTQDSHAAVAGDQELSIVGVSATVALDNGLSAGINYSQIDVDLGTVIAAADRSFSGTHVAVGASYSFGDFAVHANYGEFDWDSNATVEDATGFGLAASYDLGGGLSAHVGYGDSDIGSVNGVLTSTATSATAARTDASTWSVGLNMSF
ncbi:porin [Gymnodinialimonas ulvae]|uniref:porin n=1 Tax=Gymnodinialimonas ulvae TaxID=3126504 RepID=UPI0030999EAF